MVLRRCGKEKRYESTTGKNDMEGQHENVGADNCI
jgi:hypothetical protein